MREELIIKILNKSSEFLSDEQIQQLRGVLDIEMYDYDVTPATKALVPVSRAPEMLMLYLATKKLEGLAAKSLKSYQRAIGKFMATVQKDVENITDIDCKVYVAKYSSTGVSKSSLNTLITILRTFFEWLADNDYIVKNPMRKIKSVKTDKYVRKALTFEEFERLRDASETFREKVLVEFLYSTGCRLDEVCKLNKSDINWKTESLFVVGKGSKERQVFLTAGAMIKLQNYLKSRKDDNDALFVQERAPHSRLGHRAIQKEFSEIGKRAGITKAVYPHLLRHTMATHALKRGASLAEVQMMLGHENPGTTQIYARVDNEALQISHKKHVS